MALLILKLMLAEWLRGTFPLVIMTGLVLGWALNYAFGLPRDPTSILLGALGGAAISLTGTLLGWSVAAWLHARAACPRCQRKHKHRP